MAKFWSWGSSDEILVMAVKLQNFGHGGQVTKFWSWGLSDKILVSFGHRGFAGGQGVFAGGQVVFAVGQLVFGGGLTIVTNLLKCSTNSRCIID